MAETYSEEIKYVGNKIVRFANEVHKSVSGNNSGVNPYDMGRANNYLDSVEAALSYVNSQPQLDLPETSPEKQVCKDYPEFSDLDNDELDLVLGMWKRLHGEIVNGQSSRQASGLHPADFNRATALIAKSRTFLNSYVANLTPQDLPETSPNSDVSGPGTTGV